MQTQAPKRWHACRSEELQASVGQGCGVAGPVQKNHADGDSGGVLDHRTYIFVPGSGFVVHDRRWPWHRGQPAGNSGPGRDPAHGKTTRASKPPAWDASDLSAQVAEYRRLHPTPAPDPSTYTDETETLSSLDELTAPELKDIGHVE